MRSPNRNRPTPVTFALLAGLSALYLLSLAPGGMNLNSFINGPMVRDLAQVGGNARILSIEGGEFWRLLTATLLHGGFVHLLMNGLALWNLGGQLEEFVGGDEVLFAFVVTGIVGSLFSTFLGNPQVLSIGASGAICGLFGFICAVGTHTLGQLFSQVQRNAINIVLLLGLGFIIPNVDNWAHIGGLVSGLALGYVYRRPARGVRTWLGVGSAAVLLYGAYLIASRAVAL
jgi:rhomboid protease GluP